MPISRERLRNPSRATSETKPLRGRPVAIVAARMRNLNGLECGVYERLNPKGKRASGNFRVVASESPGVRDYAFVS